MPSASTNCGGVKFQRRADAGCGAHGAEHGGRMKARFVGECRRHGAEPAHGFDADGDAKQRRASVEIVPLAGRQHRRHDHRAGMNRAAFERVVKILAVDRGAVDQRCCGGGKRARMPDRRARAIVIAAGQRSLHIIFVARSDERARPRRPANPRTWPAPHRASAPHRAHKSFAPDARQRRSWEALLTSYAIRNAQYLFAIGNSSAGNSVITRQPLSVTTTSSSMRAAEKPSVAGQ